MNGAWYSGWMKPTVALTPAKAFGLVKAANGSAHGLQNNFLAASHCGFGSAVRFIAEENPAAAVRFGNSLIDRVAILENFPLIGSVYPKRPDVRKLVARPYIVFYRFRKSKNSVDVLRYWHGAQREPDVRSLD